MNRSILLTSSLACLAFAACDHSEPLGDPASLGPDVLDTLDDDASPRSLGTATFEIELHNETSSQWLSPCLCAIHHPAAQLFAEGRAASTGTATFAEDGYNGVLAEELREHPWVYSVLECEPGLTPPGGSRTEILEGPAWAAVTCAAMPVTTNDVLTVASGPLPHTTGTGFDHASVEWDVGSEHDDYSPSSIPLDSVDLDESGHPTVLSFFSRRFVEAGLLTAEGTMEVFDEYVGSSDFPADLYGWAGSASTWTVTRIQ